MVQSICSVVVLGGTGIALLGGCLAQANGPLVLPLAAITFFFAVGFIAHLSSLKKQS